jgi:hypothetical protein
MTQLDAFLAMLNVGDMRAHGLPDSTALVLSRIAEIDKHEFGHVSEVLRAERTGALHAAGSG